MNRRTESWIAASLLLTLFTTQVMSARLKSPTYDEQAYITAGYAFVRLRDLHILVGEPILLGALEALPLLALPDLYLPVDHPSWAGTNFHPIAEQFLWYANDNTDQILFLSRLPTMLLTLLLAAFIYRWARDAFGPWAGMLSLILCAFDPNLIAHGRLATTDLGSTTFIFIATYWLWRLLRKPTWTTCIASGVFFGLAQAARFSALL
ncbi:MAG: glycosyltransferase family 39 protein, partial [Anaerolineae bacterium]|nr:glycosyltransferase family 39 protein [Anaerolineae bacterium]